MRCWLAFAQISKLPGLPQVGFVSMPNWLRPVKMSIGAKAFSNKSSF